MGASWRGNDMRVYLNFATSLHRSITDKIDKKSNSVEVELGTSVRQLLLQLKVPVDEARIIFVNGVEAEGHQILKDGDRLGIVPAVAGG
jgi:sulfur carrier protein ThiS